MSARTEAPAPVSSWRGLSLDERYFLKIAQKNGLVTDADISEVLRARASLQTRGRSRSVQEIMLDAGMLSPEQVDAIHDAQAASQTIRLDSLYADIALRLAIADRQQLEAMFQLQREREYKVRVGELLVDRGLVTSGQHRRVLTELLQSLRADEKEYMRAIGLKRRLAPEGDSPEAEQERMRMLRTQPGAGPATGQERPGAAAAKRARAPGPPPPVPEPVTAAEPPAGGTEEAPAPPSSPGPTTSLQDWLGKSSSSGRRVKARTQEDAGPPASGDDAFASSDDDLILDVSRHDSSPRGRPGASAPPPPTPAEQVARAIAESGREGEGALPDDSDAPAPESFLQSNITRIRERSRARADSSKRKRAGRRSGRSKRENGSGAKAPRRRPGARGRRKARPLDHSSAPDMSKFLESAMDVIEEERGLGPSDVDVQKDDILAVQDDLRDVDQLIDRGYRSFKDLSRRSSDASRGEVFSTERYLQRRRRRTLLTRVLVAGVVLLVLVPTGIGIHVAHSNTRAFADARAALEDGDLDRADARAAQAGPFWIGAGQLEALRDEITLARALAPVRQQRAAGRHAEALGALRAVRQAHPEHMVALDALDRDIKLEAALAEGEGLERSGDLTAAVAAYRRAARMAPEAPAPGQRVDALRTRLRDEIVAAEATADAAPDDQAGQARKLAAYRRYLEVFQGEGAEIERKLMEHELSHHLAEADRAVRGKRYDDALNHYFRAGGAAEQLDRPGLRAEIEEKTRIAHRLARFQTSYNEAQGHERAGRYGEAVRSYRQAGAWIPEDDPRAVLLKARVQACESARAAREAGAEAERLWAEALSALRSSRMSQAQAALRALLDKTPDDQKAQRTLTLAERLDDMVYVPAGEAVIGTDLEDAPAARPRHTVTLPAFFIDRYEVRNRVYGAWITQTGEVPPEHWTAPTEGEARSYAHEHADHPVVGVSFSEAQRFAGWAGKRLPTEQEWERAARGGDDRTWPWGDAEDRERVNLAAASSERIPIHTKPVGTSADDQSPVGCMDMAGNVSEWTTSAFTPYPDAERRAAPFDASRKVLRGGSWRYGLHYARAFNRDRAEPETRSPHLGFRCVVDVPEWLVELR
jgi:formylglycine-generating enzyme required for sulfatase activity